MMYIMIAFDALLGLAIFGAVVLSTEAVMNRKDED